VTVIVLMMVFPVAVEAEVVLVTVVVEAVVAVVVVQEEAELVVVLVGIVELVTEKGWVESGVVVLGKVGVV
jgi:hypothetical protein